VNYDNSLVVTITVTCYSWAPSSGDHSFTCGAICWLPQCSPWYVSYEDECLINFTTNLSDFTQHFSL